MTSKDKKGKNWKEGLKDAATDAVFHGLGEMLKTAGERIKDIVCDPEPCEEEEEREEKGEEG